MKVGSMHPASVGPSTLASELVTPYDVEDGSGPDTFLFDCHVVSADSCEV